MVGNLLKMSAEHHLSSGRREELERSTPYLQETAATATLAAGFPHPPLLCFVSFSVPFPPPALPFEKALVLPSFPIIAPHPSSKPGEAQKDPTHVAPNILDLLGMWELTCQCQEMSETQVQSLGQEDTLRRAWQPTPVFLPGESHGQRSLASYGPWGHKVRHD